MHPRTVVMLLIGFCGGVMLASCGTMTTCSAATCGGCCDQNDKCQSGATTDACGNDGASCGRCGTGTMCQAGECRAATTMGGGGGTMGGGSGGGTGGGSGGGTGGGTGGGSVGGGTGGGSGGGSGGGAGGGTGGAGGCRIIASLPTEQTNLQTAGYLPFSTIAGHFNVATWVYPMAVNPDGFRFEIGYPNDQGPTVPVTQSFTAIPYRQCDVCALYYEDCPPGAARCNREYLAQSGSFTVTRADKSAAAGRLVGSATSVRFNQWNIDTDTAVGTGCVIINTIGPFDIGWNTDGGMPPP